MLLKRNLLETLTLTCCAGTLACILLNYVTNISPLTGVWFHLYILLVFILSISSSFKFLKWLLRLNKPIKYDLEGLVKEFPILRGIADVLPKNQSGTVKRDAYKDYDTNELSVISSVLERKLVSSWYVPYISEEIGFPFACKQILDQMIGKAFQICHKIETKEVYIDVCSILMSHLKEYRKAMKRQEKSQTTPIEELYKKSHAIHNQNKKITSGDHCTSILRLILKELVPWELWDTPHSELLVRILSKKLDSFIDSTLAEPSWLNDKLLTIILSDKSENDNDKAAEPDKKTNEGTKDEGEIQKDEVENKIFKNSEKQNDLIHDSVKTETNETQVENISEEIPVVLPKRIAEEIRVNGNGSNIEVIEEDRATEIIENKSPILRQRRGRQGKNEVKIYDRVIEGSVKTWETDIDLQCISLGQDLLASLDGEITLSRLWGQEAEPDGSPNPPRGKSPQPLWFGEEDTIGMDLTDSSPHKSPKKEISPKPAELLKELQTTVHQAKTKIGDLQVDAFHSGIAVATNTSGDEAAGMMEGLLDFGIAGFKKGLRFTGLGDDTQEKDKFFPTHKDRSSLEKPSPLSDLPLNRAFHDLDQKDHDGRDSDINSAVHKEENGASVPLLTKQQRVSSQDSVPLQARSLTEPSQPVLVPGGDSPEPQYEEAADLSTSIAKLRSLLEQREHAAGSLPSEDIWWQSAEETRGRTQLRPSGRPVDSASMADEYDMNAVEQTSNNIQRLDKLFHRTVTGVFNSLRTAVGAEETAGVSGRLDWVYVCASPDQSVCGAVARLVGGRRALAHVDAALDSLDQIPAPLPPQHHDDDDEWCSPRGSGATCLIEAACAAELLRSHVARRIAALLLHDLAEPLITSWLETVSSCIQEKIFATFRQISDGPEVLETKVRNLDVKETCRILLEKVPAPLLLFGEDTLTESIGLTVSSFSHKAVNRDVAFRLLDVMAYQFKMAAAIRNPSFEN